MVIIKIETFERIFSALPLFIYLIVKFYTKKWDTEILMESFNNFQFKFYLTKEDPPQYLFQRKGFYKKK